jgi:hypothetical protein
MTGQNGLLVLAIASTITVYSGSCKQTPEYLLETESVHFGASDPKSRMQPQN